ncbi:MAG TPA: hypothetical protein VFN48_10160 [Solirubrobacteraceae bacterium]|nr:hypothetical protein [Solirubrobacteraceae bacterium]
MSELLAILDPDLCADGLVAEIARRHPTRVTLLVETADGDDPTATDTPRGRALRVWLAAVVAQIEARSGAVVVGLAWGREQLSGWRFDRVIGPLNAGAPA